MCAKWKKKLIVNASEQQDNTGICYGSIEIAMHSVNRIIYHMKYKKGKMKAIDQKEQS